MIEPNTSVAEIAKMLQAMDLVAFVYRLENNVWEVKLLSADYGLELGVGKHADSWKAFNTAILAATN